MSNDYRVRRVSSGWGKRTVEVTTPEGVYQLVHSNRGISESVVVNDTISVQKPSSSWIVPDFDFRLGSLDASVNVAMKPWMQIFGFHVIVNGRVYCEDTFAEDEDEMDECPGNVCVRCNRQLVGKGLDPKGEQHYDVSSTRTMVRMLGGLVMTVGSLAFLTFLFLNPQHVRPTDVRGTVALGFFALIGLVFFVSSFFRRRYEVVLDSVELTVFDSRQEKRLAWSEIVEIQENPQDNPLNPFQVMLDWALGGRRSQSIIDQHGDKFVVLNFVEHFVPMIEEIKRRSLPYRVTDASTAIREGRVMKYGRYALAIAGLSYGTETVPWFEIERIDIVNDTMVVFRKGGVPLAWEPYPLDAPGYRALVFLAREFQSTVKPPVSASGA
jgi:hypothetical protein